MKRTIGILVAIFAVAAVGFSGIATTPVSAAGSAALTIAPKKTYVVEPGNDIEDTLRIQNMDKSKSLSLQLKVIDFTYTDDTGTPKLLLNVDTPPTAWSLKSYLKLPETVTVGPGEVKTVDLNLSMPKNQGAGSYYSAIVYSTSPGTEGGQVGLSASGVTLVFASVPGKVDEKLTLEKLGAYMPKPTGDNYVKFTMQKPTQIAYTLKNDGNVTESPVGSITYKYMFGAEKKIEDVNPNGSLALIGQKRTFVSCMQLKIQEEKPNQQQARTKVCETPGLWPGLYTVHLDLFYGQNGNNTREVIGSSYFWYLPWWFLVPFLIIVALIIIAVWRLVTKVRSALYGQKATTKRRNK